MPLTLYRRENEALFIHLTPGADHAKVIKMLATTGIEIRVCNIKKSGVGITINAPDSIKIRREELLGTPPRSIGWQARIKRWLGRPAKS